MKRNENNESSHYSEMFELIYRSEKISKQEIAQRLDLSLPTVTQTLRQLMDDEQIVTDGKFSSNVGRRAVVYSPNKGKIYAVGIELFADHATLTLLDVMYTDLGHETINLQFTIQDEYFNRLGHWLHDFLHDQKIAVEKIVGVGVGIQGLISADGRTVLYGKILDCTGLTSDVFERAFQLPVTLYHDADCVAIAEQALSGDHQDAIYLSIGEHLGSAIIINDQIYTGQNGRSGTMEHITLNSQNGKLCYCGRRGCLETFCSLSALLKSNETIDSFITQVRAGDPECVQRWKNYLNDLAEVINDLHMFVDNRLVIAGVLVRYLDQSVVDQISEKLKKITAFPEDRPYVELGIIKERAVSIGAAVPLITQVLQDI
ncbi:ROK family transcriptional regulator [Secundilactobacillus folii]|uniref:ROK family protein n=1 Tax=Secundilactobacillus folii TaxID=2678357 RepID=A0A7X2XUU6_9LACO|nr:ROK family transcriptional regulator [Secundilactobacillus folii]MTV81490.1 ROK family protein [Secundilactobacillus folii]